MEAAGFDAVYASGGAIARAAGYPDIGLLSFSEVMDRVEKIVDAGGLPVVADADTGFGGSANVERTVRAMERAGVAAFHIEDQSFPKRCGHLDDKSLIDAGEMCRKIRIARQTLSDDDALVIARTDAIAVEGFDAAIARAERYIEAGADMIFVEAPETLEQIRAIAQRLPGLKLINMFYGGKTPLVPLPELEAMGYHLSIIPGPAARRHPRHAGDAGRDPQARRQQRAGRAAGQLQGARGDRADPALSGAGSGVGREVRQRLACSQTLCPCSHGVVVDDAISIHVS